METTGYKRVNGTVVVLKILFKKTETSADNMFVLLLMSTRETHPATRHSKKELQHIQYVNPKGKW